MTKLLALLFCYVLACLCGCGGGKPEPGTKQISRAEPGAKQVSRADYGTRWPLTVESGLLRCQMGSAVTFETGGRVYALNGMAETWKLGEDIKPIWAAGDPIWVRDRNQNGKMVNVGPNFKYMVLIADGLELCKELAQR